MRKLLVVLLTVALIFAFAACNQQTAPAEEPVAEEGLTAIPLGGDLGELDVSGAAYGSYVQIDAPDEDLVEEGMQAEFYAAEGSDTPYISVFRWAKNGQTLEEVTAAMAEKYGTSHYLFPAWPELNMDNVGYYVCGDYTEDGRYLLIQCNILEDGDDFVEIDFCLATEELALGDSGSYLWLPTGYTDVLAQDDIDHGGIFHGKYAEDYYLPTVWVGKYDSSYAYQEWMLKDAYPDGLPVDEATYNGWLEAAAAEGWTDELNRTYYDTFGFDNYVSYYGEAGGFKLFAYSVTRDGSYLNDIFLEKGDDCYNLILSGPVDYACAKAIVDSLHTK